MNEKKTVFLTGGARGIGAAIREEMTLRGYEVVAPSRKELDLADPQSIEKYLSDHADLSVDILINNAGMNIPKPIGEISLENLLMTMQVNLSSAFRLIQFFAPQMARCGYGRILNVSSILGVLAKEGRAAYSMSKAALDALTRASAVEFGSRGVLVNSLAPGYVDTELTRRNNSPEQIADLLETIPLNRMASPAELAKIAGFLVSSNNSYITGQTILADGGITCL